MPELDLFITTRIPDEEKNRLLRNGLTAEGFPLIKTVPVEFSAEEALNPAPDFVVFSSKNGVKYFFDKVSPEFLKNSKIIAVGASTAQTLSRYGFTPLTPEEFSADGIVELLKGFNVSGKTFLIVRPKVARKKVPEFLKASGAKVREAVVYETVTDDSKKDELLRALEKIRPNAFIAFTSPSNLKAFLKLGGERGKEALKSSKIIPIGSVTEKAIREEGFSVWKIPKVFTVSGIVECILEFADGKGSP